MPQRKHSGLAALALAAALLPGPVLGGGVVLGAAGCGDGCFDCRDSGCGCKSGEICSESEQLPASMSPESVREIAVAERRERCADCQRAVLAWPHERSSICGSETSTHHTVWSCKAEEKKAR